MRRFFILLAALYAVVVYGEGNGFKMITPGPGTSVWAIGLSPDGRYMSCWMGTDGAGSSLYDTQTEEYYYYTSWSEYDAVSNTGLMVGYGANNFAYNPLTNEEYINPDGYEVLGRGVNADGTIVVGVIIENGYQYRACYYEDGELKFLVKEPNTRYGQESEALDVSDDKSIICGHTNSGFTLWHRTADGEYEAETISSVHGQPTAMSHNGRYVALNMGGEDNVGYVGRYDTTTGELETAYFYASNDVIRTCSATRISNDGTMLVHTNDASSQFRRALIWEKGGEIEYMAEKYSLVPEFAEYDEDDWNYGTNISSDGRYIIGMAWHYIEGDGEYYARRISWYFDREEYAAYATALHPTPAAPEAEEEEYYSIDGTKLNAPRKGLNIIKSGGRTRKAVVR